MKGARWAAMGPEETFLQLGNLAFDASTLEIWAPLLNGGRLALFPGKRPGLDELADAIARYGVTSLWLTAGLFHQMVGERLEGLRPLRQLLAGGDVLSPAHVRRALEGLPGCTIVNGYGPTENTTFTTCFPMREWGGWDFGVPIGRPIQGTRVHVVDGGLRPVPVGVWGELLAGGEGVARGYLGRPALTAERFIPDPWGDGARLYRTGDLVRWRPDGLLEFLGRRDGQVKIRGFRVELGEIEAALALHPAVREAVVVARPVTGTDNQLVAYVAHAAGADAEELRAFLRDRLPEAMIPAFFVSLDSLPLTANGKVDRRALPDPRPAAADEPAGDGLPRDATEERLAAIWREVLRLDRVGVHDNFFQLGGDSILSIQIVARARREGLLITPRLLFEHQTVAELAAVAVLEGGAGSAGEDQGPVTGEAPLTPVQRRFLAEGRREPGRFNQAVLLAPRERLAAAPLAAALDRLAAHHDALRLRFIQEQGEWRQIHAPVEPVPLVEIDLRGMPSGRLETAAERLQSGLDLARGPLLTAALFHLEEGDRLLLTAHHLVVDGVSWRVLLEDLEAACRGLPLPPKTTSWKRWAERLDGFARSPEIAAELPYWRALPVPVPPLPRDLPGDGAPARATVAVELGPEETRALLQEVPEVYRTQVNDLLLAALARAFAAWTGEPTLLVDLEGHGREEVFQDTDLSRTVGWFTTVFPVALSLPPGDSPRDAIRAVKETLRAVPRRGLGYGLLRYQGDPESAASLAALPEPEVSFNYLGRFDGAAGEGGLFAFAPETVRGAAGEVPAGAPLFAVDALVLDGRLRVSWTYDPGRHLPVDRRAAGERLPGRDRGARRALPFAGGRRLHPLRLPARRPGPGGARPPAGKRPERRGPLPPGPHAGGDAVPQPLRRPPFETGRTSTSSNSPPCSPAPWTRPPSPPPGGGPSSATPRCAPASSGTASSGRCSSRGGPSRSPGRARTGGISLPRPSRRAGAASSAPTAPGGSTSAGRRCCGSPWRARARRSGGWSGARTTSCSTAGASRCCSTRSSRSTRRRSPAATRRSPRRAPTATTSPGWKGAIRPRPTPTGGGCWTASRRPPRCRSTAPEPSTARSAAVPRTTTSGRWRCRRRSPRSLEALAQRLRVTLNTVVQGAWALLLSQYAQEPDVVFGAVVSGRPPELPRRRVDGGAVHQHGAGADAHSGGSPGRRAALRLAAAPPGGPGRAPPARVDAARRGPEAGRPAAGRAALRQPPGVRELPLRPRLRRRGRAAGRERLPRRAHQLSAHPDGGGARGLEPPPHRRPPLRSGHRPAPAGQPGDPSGGLRRRPARRRRPAARSSARRSATR